MAPDWFIVLGGVGMFLLGMEVMTTALKEAAGGNLRWFLARFTSTPLHGTLTGAASTAVIQSSSATTVMTVGFVGAGLMSLSQALGVIYGANIGTTATGWLVSLLGFKLQLGQLAMIGLPLASLAILLGRGALSRAARVVAGLCLLLIGLDLMQDGMSGVTELITPDRVPGNSLIGRLALVLFGVALTVLIQSSSAALALALVMLQGGAIGLIQAAAVVIGMNIGTTFTALLASVGGSPPMRQVAVANLVFNIVTSLLAFPLLVLGSGALTQLAVATGPLTALLVFHTGFNLAGAALFLPLTERFAGVVRRMVPDIKPEGLVVLDRGLLDNSAAALVAALSASEVISRRIYRALARTLQAEPDYRDISALEPKTEEAIRELEAYLADIRLPPDRPEDEAAYSALLHQIDHLRRLLARTHDRASIDILREDRVLRRPALTLGALLARAQVTDADMEPDRLAWLRDIVEKRTHRHRRAMLLGEHAGLFSVQDVFTHTDAMRWLRRVLHHTERIGHYDQVARQGLRPSKPEPES